MKVVIVTPVNKQEFDNVLGLGLLTKDGEIEVRPGHEPLVSALEIGEVRIMKQGEEIKLVINEGVLRVAGDEAMILTNDLAMAKDLVKEEIETAMKQAECRKDEPLLPTELIQMEKEIRYEKLKRKVRDNFGNG